MYFMLRTEEGTILINPDKVVYFESDKEGKWVTLTNGERLRIFDDMERIVELTF